VILIVDDHSDSAQVLKKMLALKGIAAVCTSSAQEALKLAPALHPDLIILDQMMPGTTGLEAFRTMHNDPKLASIPVLFYSAANDEAAEREAMDLGAQGWLTKGRADWDDILSAVSRARKN
jgi:CheY-like chemotaxis protein